MKKVFSSSFFWVTLFSFILIALSFYPLYHHFKITPPNTVYLAQHNSILDFPMFISEIRQGQQGHLTGVQKLTSESQIGTWVHLFYLAAGWITGPFRLNPVFVYHASRAVVGFLLLLTFYLFIKQFFKDKFTSLTIFFLTAFAGGFPRIKFDQGRFWLIDWPYMQFFSGYDVLRRVTFLPHGLMRDVLFLGVLIFWIKLWETKKLKFFWWAAVSGFFLGFFSPIHALVLYLVLSGLIAFALLKLLFEQREKFKIILGFCPRTIIVLVISYLLLTLPSSLYIYWVFKVTVWKVVADWEASQWFPIPLSEYSLGTGPLFFLAIPAVFFVILSVAKDLLRMQEKFSNELRDSSPSQTRLRMTTSENLKYYLLVSVPFLTLFALFSPLAKSVGLLNFRFLGIPLQVFWGVLGGLTVVWLAKKIATFLCHSRAGGNLYNNYLNRFPIRSGMTGKIYKSSLVILSLLIFLPTLPSYLVSLKTQDAEFTPPVNFNIYAPKNFYAGLLWLEKNTSPEDLVFSDITIGNLIPAYSGNYVYVGHSVSTVNYYNKLKEVAKFYQTVMPPSQARKFLLDRSAKYVVWSYDEHGHCGDQTKYASFLILRFSNPDIQIYEVK